MINVTENDLVRWEYNCLDINYTYEINEILTELLNNETKSLQNFYNFQINEIAPALAAVMHRGVKVDLAKKQELLGTFKGLLLKVENDIEGILGFPINLSSPKQIKILFTDYFDIVPIVNKKTKTESFGSDAMLVYLEQYPLLAPLLTLILEYRSISIFVRTFLSAKVDIDGYMRTSYNVAGTRTYRLSSRKNAFGSGCMPSEKAEAYTPNGWVKLSDKPNTILQYTKEGTLEFVNTEWSGYDYKGKIYNYSGRCFRGSFTPEHRIVKSKRDKLHFQEMKDVYTLHCSYSVPVSGEYSPTNVSRIVTDNWLQRLVMLSADGSKDSELSWRIYVKKQRKKDRIKLIAPEGTHSKCPEGYVRVRISNDNYTKRFPSWLINLPLQQRKLFIEELRFWDGHSRGNSFLYFTTIEANADLVQTLCHLSGFSASISVDYDNNNGYGSGDNKPLHTVNISPKTLNSLDSFRWNMVDFEGTVSCPTVPSSMWLVRYDGGIHITGNCNLQNLPSKGKIDLKYSLMTTEVESDLDSEDISLDVTTPVYGNIQLPNCKELFIPSEVDETFFDIDLAAADARIVAWLSGCKFLTELFEDPAGDIYLALAKEYYRDNTITKKDYRRQIFKAVAHATNYLGRPATISAKAGLLVHEVEAVQKFYFSLCPEIPALHRDIEKQVKTKGYLTNCWGAKGWFLDHKDPMLMNKAMAWAGSSPVGILINKGLVSIETTDKAIKVRLQVHDSLAGTYKTDDVTAPQRIIEHCSIPLPFDIPRTIPVNIKTGKNYGSCS
jgi:hypothetical protein